MTAIRVNGGILNDQSLAGSLIYFKIVGTFAYAISDGTVTVGPGYNLTSTSPTYDLVDTNEPVPGSLAEHVIKVLSEKCTVVSIGFVGAPGAETEMHIAVNGTAFGWVNASGAIDTAAMVSAISAVGATITVPTTHAGAEHNNTIAPVTATPSTTVTVTESPFELA